MVEEFTSGVANTVTFLDESIQVRVFKQLSSICTDLIDNLCSQTVQNFRSNIVENECCCPEEFLDDY